MPSVRNLFGYSRPGPGRCAAAPVLPMSHAEMAALGWDACDVLLVTGDAYVDHPSFGMALIGRLLEAQGLRVAILSQPDWHSADAFRALGRPTLFVGITAGNMDSMVNRYTADGRLRSDDAYTPGGAGGRRPDRAVIVYAQRAREALGGVPIVIGGIEASLRRAAHYDYWSDKVRRSILLDSKADLLVHGNAERQIVEIAHRLAAGEPIRSITDVRGTALAGVAAPEGWTEIDASRLDRPGSLGPGASAGDRTVIRLPSFEEVAADPVLYAHASRLLHRETNPGNARALVQRHGARDLWLHPPPFPLSTAELDRVYELPYSRRPHPAYGDARIPAYEMIRFSITIQRGCFGGCSFCSITEHEGRIVQSRSAESVVREIERVRETVPGFTGVISDLGGPTANLYRLRCRSAAIEAVCRRPSCVYPGICKQLETDHAPLIALYRRARAVPGVSQVLIGSGVRYDLAVRSPDYVAELAAHHVGGYLKIAPEHVCEGPLRKMGKPGIATYDRFKELFDRGSRAAGKTQYLVPYFIAAHPGTTDEDMLELALWLKRNGFKADQVQTFLPAPMASATAMYHTGKNPLAPVSRTSEDVVVPKGLRARRLHKAFLRYHDPANWPRLRAALRRMGRADLIGSGAHQLVPALESPARPGRPGRDRKEKRGGLAGPPAGRPPAGSRRLEPRGSDRPHRNINPGSPTGPGKRRRR
ncbi:MAG: YgiQ family radical SAM protein [Planctomycetes bacterium]|nr:YgiQ family radical SAM protein [Planctomycetota bacterium]